MITIIPRTPSREPEPEPDDIGDAQVDPGELARRRMVTHGRRCGLGAHNPGLAGSSPARASTREAGAGSGAQIAPGELAPRAAGKPRRPPIVTRYDERSELDEIVAFNAYVHLERMTDHHFALIVEAGGRTACFNIGALQPRSQANVTAFEVWNEPVRKAGRRRDGHGAAGGGTAEGHGSSVPVRTLRCERQLRGEASREGARR